MRLLLWGASAGPTFRRVLNTLSRAGFDVVGCSGFKECAPLLKAVWLPGNAVIAVAPAPLTVRLTAPLVKGKALDPAVVAVIPSGRAAIPLLNEHWGAAMVCEVLESLGCVEHCLETSALACAGIMSPDDMAYRLRSSLISGGVDAVRAAVSRLLKEGRLRAFLDGPALTAARGLRGRGASELLKRLELVGSPGDAEFCIASRPERGCGGASYLLRRVAAGVGFCSVAAGDSVVEALMNVLKLLDMHPSRLSAVAVPARRLGHEGVRALREAGFKVVPVRVEDAICYGVRAGGGRFGVRSVAEALARSVLGGGTPLIVKSSFTNVTISVVEAGGA